MSTKTSKPTGIGPIDWALGWALYLTVGLIALAISMLAFINVIAPMLSEGAAIGAFALWFLLTIYLIGLLK